MESIDWKKLAPHRPLRPSDPLYVSRPFGGGERLAALLKSGLGPITVAGPAGIGKSTELAAAARVLHPHSVACLIPLDRFLDVRQAEEEAVQRCIAGRLAELAIVNFRLGLSEALVTSLVRGGSLPEDLLPSSASGLWEPPASWRDVLIATIREVAKLSSQGRVTLLLDGVEKAPVDASLRAVRALLDLGDEANLALVVPLALVTGPEAHELLSETRLFSIRALPVREQLGAGWSEARQFLFEVAERRLGLGSGIAEIQPLFDAAADMSGGIPRTFLQLLQDAGGYAALAGRRMPTVKEDLFSAALDHHESLRRLLRDGDDAVLNLADGSPGLEVPLDRRIRFVSQGLLLEYDLNNRVVVHPHPLLQPPAEYLPP
jgi:hypothetical protein